jgi:hypothetical protein
MTIWESRIDFDRIKRAQDARHKLVLSELRSLLFKMQKDTLVWVNDNLVRKKLKTAVPKFKAPQQAAYRSLLRKRMTSAAIRGSRDVASEMDLDAPRMKVRDLTRIRAAADALFNDHITRLEADLKREWAGAMQGNISKSQLEYLTKKVFADFAGWEPPDGPDEPD